MRLLAWAVLFAVTAAAAAGGHEPDTSASAASRVAQQLIASFGAGSTASRSVRSQADGQLGQHRADEVHADAMQQAATQHRVDWRDTGLVRRALAQLGMAVPPASTHQGGIGGTSALDLAAASEELQLTASQLDALRQALTQLGVAVPPQARSDEPTEELAEEPIKELADEAIKELADVSADAVDPSAPGGQAPQRPARELLQSYPVGSGDNLLEYRKRVQQLKQYYRDARTYLGPDDAVRIGGYIARVERLALQFTSAFPVSEIQFFNAGLILSADIIRVIFFSLRVGAIGVDISARSLALSIAIERARLAATAAAAAAGAPPAGDSSASASAQRAAAVGTGDSGGAVGVYGGVPGTYGGRAGLSSSTDDGYVMAGDPRNSASASRAVGGDYSSSADAVLSAPMTESTIAATAALQGVDSAQLNSDLMAATAQLQSQLLPWIANGGLNQPLVLAGNVLKLTQASLSRLQQWQDPSSTLTVDAASLMGA